MDGGDVQFRIWHNKKLCDLYSSGSVVRTAGALTHSSDTQNKKCIYKLDGKISEKQPVRRPRRKHYAMMTRRGVEEQLHSFLTIVLNEGKRSASYWYISRKIIPVTIQWEAGCYSRGRYLCHFMKETMNSVQLLTWAGRPWQHCLAVHSWSCLLCASLDVAISAPRQSPLVELLPVDPIQEPVQLQITESIKIKYEETRMPTKSTEWMLCTKSR